MISRKGLTLTELLVVVSILFLLGAIAFSVLSGFRRTSILNAAVEDGISLLYQARSRTLSSQSALQHGVHFESGRMVLFRGATYSSGESTNEIVLLPNGVEISTITLNGGGVDVIFLRLTGATNNFGSTTFRSKYDTSITKTINIQASGAPGL